MYIYQQYKCPKIQENMLVYILNTFCIFLYPLTLSILLRVSSNSKSTPADGPFPIYVRFSYVSSLCLWIKAKENIFNGTN